MIQGENVHSVLPLKCSLMATLKATFLGPNNSFFAPTLRNFSSRSISTEESVREKPRPQTAVVRPLLPGCSHEIKPTGLADSGRRGADCLVWRRPPREISRRQNRTRWRHTG